MSIISTISTTVGNVIKFRPPNSSPTLKFGILNRTRMKTRSHYVRACRMVSPLPYLIEISKRPFFMLENKIKNNKNKLKLKKLKKIKGK